MNFCSNCGAKCNTNANFCSNCGMALNAQSPQRVTNNSMRNNLNSDSLLGTLVTVQLINGLTKNLYEKNGDYYSDQACHHKFNPAMIMSVMGADSDNMIDAMTLTGNKVDMETLHRNHMSQMHMNSFRRKRR